MRDRGKTPNRKIQLHHRDLCKVFFKKNWQAHPRKEKIWATGFWPKENEEREEILEECLSLAEDIILLVLPPQRVPWTK